jgi:hypothetical protein
MATGSSKDPWFFFEEKEQKTETIRNIPLPWRERIRGESRRWRDCSPSVTSRRIKLRFGKREGKIEEKDC